MQAILKLVRITATLLLAALLSQAAFATELTSTVNRNQLSTNETLVLTVTITDQLSGSQLDTSGLQSDFEILGVVPQSRNSVSVINGQTTQQASTTWTITLVPKREGQLTIPAFNIAGATSQPITISVDNSTRNASADAPLEVFVLASGDSVYPAQPLIVEIELSAASDVSDLNGSPLLVENAEVESLGQQNFQRVDNGLARQVVVLKYAVFAKDPGKIIIPVLTYSGIKGQQRGFFNRGGQQVIARSEQLDITVQPTPEDSSAPWFPASDVSIKSNWSSDTREVKVGEPITRSITVTAKGQRATQIPPIKRPVDGAYKSYRDQPQLATQADMSGIVGTRIESEAIVPNQQGELRLPELRLSWWNVNSKQWEQAILPAETLSVTSVASAQLSPSAETPLASAAGTNSSASVASPGSQNVVGWQVATGLLATICLMQFWMLRRKRHSGANIDKPASSIQQSERQAWAELKKSFEARDAQSIRRGILAWAQACLPTSGTLTLSSLAQHSADPQLAGELAKLDAMIYRGNAQVDVVSLAAALNRLRSELLKNRAEDKTGPALEPLYINQ